MELKLKVSLALLFLGLLLTQSTQASRSWQKEMFPTPHLNPDQCGRGDVSMICDPDAVLTETEKAKDELPLH